ncbi:MAG TPA: hypothetical protein PK095_24760 [Myxococcota bacterium]|nr:hypothetical protein [Myxococcota bacterium]
MRAHLLIACALACLFAQPLRAADADAVTVEAARFSDALRQVVRAASSDEARGVCPVDTTRVLLAGSSTMGSPLGGMLDKALSRLGHVVKRRVKASSGLARPDFFDWKVELERSLTEHDPDIVVLQLGSNDFQPIRFAERQAVSGRPIVKRQSPRWAEIYGERVDELLDVIGPDRLVIWVGAYAFWGDNALEQGPIIEDVVADRLGTHIARGGHARYLSAWRETFDPRHGPLMERPLPGRGRGRVPIRASDRIHLNALAVELLLRDPVLADIAACREPLEDRVSR